MAAKTTTMSETVEEAAGGRLVVEYVAPDALRPAPYNPRTMSAESFDRLKEGIRDFGLVDPILARAEDRLVIGGHQRLEAAKALGLDTVPVVFLPGLSDERAAMLNVRLNNPNVQGTWDMRLLTDLLSELDGTGADLMTGAGFSAQELEALLTWTPGDPSAGAYTPNTAPTIGSRTVTDDEVARTGDRLDDRFRDGGRELRPITCPNCATDFFVDA